MLDAKYYQLSLDLNNDFGEMNKTSGPIRENLISDTSNAFVKEEIKTLLN